MPVTTYQGLANLPSKCSNRVGLNSGNHPCSYFAPVTVTETFRPFSVSWYIHTSLSTDTAPCIAPPLSAVFAPAVAWPPNCQPELMNESMAAFVLNTKTFRNFDIPKPNPACSSIIFMYVFCLVLSFENDTLPVTGASKQNFKSHVAEHRVASSFFESLLLPRAALDTAAEESAVPSSVCLLASPLCSQRTGWLRRCTRALG